MEQGSKEWLQARCGVITASRIADLMATNKSGFSTSRANYAAQLVAERMTGNIAESFSNAAMEWGTATEPAARIAYEWFRDVSVVEVGLVPHPTIERSGASPDGLVGDLGLVEIKCPNTATHIGYLLDGKVPPKYQPQMAWQLSCTGRQWCDFVSFDPRMGHEDQFFCVRYEPPKIYIGELELAVRQFDREIEETIQKVIARRTRHLEAA